MRIPPFRCPSPVACSHLRPRLLRWLGAWSSSFFSEWPGRSPSSSCASPHLGRAGLALFSPPAPLRSAGRRAEFFAPRHMLHCPQHCQATDLCCAFRPSVAGRWLAFLFLAWIRCADCHYLRLTPELIAECERVVSKTFPACVAFHKPSFVQQLKNASLESSLVYGLLTCAAR